MSEQPTPDSRVLDDRGFVELVRGVLVDPNLHTDTRMRLLHEITELLRSSNLSARGRAPAR